MDLKREIIVLQNKFYSKPLFFKDIQEVVKQLDLDEETVLENLSLPENEKEYVNGYIFVYKRYKGEILVDRRNNLDFTKEFEEVTAGLRANLPRYSYQDRIEHYNKKINLVWEKFGIKEKRKWMKKTQ